MEFYVKNLVNFKNLQSIFSLNVTEYLIGETKTGEKWPLFNGDQYFLPTNNFTRPKKFISYFFS